MRRATIARVLALFAVLLLAVACGNDDDPAMPDAPLEQLPDGVGDSHLAQMNVRDNRFDHETLAAPAGVEYKLLLANNGDNSHTFTIPDLGVEATLEPGGTGDVTFTFPDQPMEFICTVHPDEMRGTLQPE